MLWHNQSVKCQLLENFPLLVLVVVQSINWDPNTQRHKFYNMSSSNSILLDFQECNFKIFQKSTWKFKSLSIRISCSCRFCNIMVIYNMKWLGSPWMLHYLINYDEKPPLTTTLMPVLTSWAHTMNSGSEMVEAKNFLKKCMFDYFDSQK